MAKTITFTASADGSYDFIVDADGLLHGIEDADTLDQLSATKLRIIGHNGTHEIDNTVDTVILDKTAIGGTSVTYGPGSNTVTVFRALKPVFIKRNTGAAGSGTASSLDTVTDGSARFAMTTAQRDFLNQLMSAT